MYVFNMYDNLDIEFVNFKIRDCKDVWGVLFFNNKFFIFYIIYILNSFFGWDKWYDFKR